MIDGSETKLAVGRLLLLDVGKHDVRVKARGYASEQRVYWVEAGEAETWDIELRRTVDGGS